MTNQDIVSSNLDLIRTCCQFQISKYGTPQELLDDLVQEMCLILLEYDNSKLNTILMENHLNAFITGILVKTLYSKNSQFYRTFRKFSAQSDDISTIE